MVKKGMSADEKRNVILGILRDSKRPFVLKDLEKLAAKAGVVLQSVKDVVSSCVDDNLVDMDKIGSTNWFWSFPSKDAAAKRTKLRALAEKAETLKSSLASLEERKTELLRDRPQTEERAGRIAMLNALRAEKKTLEDELASAKAHDPEEARKLKRLISEAKLASDRWTDNTFAVMDWLRKSHGLSRKDAAQQLGVSDDFDYAEFVPSSANKKKPASASGEA